MSTNRVSIPGHPEAVFWKLNKCSPKHHSLDFDRLGGIGQANREETGQSSRERQMSGNGWNRQKAQEEKLGWAAHVLNQSPVGLLVVLKCTQDFVLIRYGKTTALKEELITYKRKGHVLPCRVTGGSPRGSQEAEGVRGKHWKPP